MPHPQVIVLTVTYGKRWNFLLQVITATMKDPHVTKLIIVDNGSKNKEEIVQGTKEYGERIVVLRQERNLGSAGGFALGLAYVRTLEGDFVFLLDDDNVPEDGAISTFLDLYKLFPDEKVVLSGNRLNIPGSQEYFYHSPIRNVIANGTFFDILSFSKLKAFLRIFLSSGKKNATRGIFIPIVPNEGFIYGGLFMPISAVRTAPLPDASLVLYGDDIEYSWGVIKAGYTSYLCANPKIYDIDLTFGEGSHIFGIFDPETQAFKVYYRIRNMVRISIRNTQQQKWILLLNIFIWICASCILGFSKYGATQTFFSRVKLIVIAVYGGYIYRANIPEEAKLP